MQLRVHKSAVLIMVISSLVMGSMDASPAHTVLTGDLAVVKAQRGWRSILSVEDVWTNCQPRIRRMIAALDCDRPGLRSLKLRLAAGDTTGALHELQNYFKKTTTGHWLLSAAKPDPESRTPAVASALLNDTVSFNGVTAQVPLTKQQGWVWTFTGPNGDQEFGYSLNGHQYLAVLLEAWKKNGDDAYVQTFDRIIRDWILHNPIPAPDDTIYHVLKGTVDKLDYRDIGEVRWRTLEAGNRLGVSWPYTFFEFQQEKAFTPAARILMLTGFVEHAQYLRQYHKRGHNWTTMEMNGLALTGLVFPEFKHAEEWTTYALDVMTNEIQRQVYPDGVQTEVSSKTQWVALRRFESVADYFVKSGRQMADDYMGRIEEMYNYLAYAMRPDGHQPLNNDADREDLRPRVLAAAKKFRRPDWEWIATNGARGVAPNEGPSITFPWAGIHVMRNGWKKDSHWTFFDTGPFGTGHQHADMLHLSIAAYGRDLLVDGGRYTHQDYFSFDPRIWRGYFRSSFSHNVILVDGQGQKAGPLISKNPLQPDVDYKLAPTYDYARGTFANGYEGVNGKIEHTRGLLYLKDQLWIVIDRIDTDRPRTLQTLWHYSPECSVKVEGYTTTSSDVGKGNLRIVPVNTSDAPIIVKGQTEPVIQGWYSKDYGKKIPSSTAVYTIQISGPATFAWVLLPAKGTVPMVKASIEEETEAGLRIKVEMPGEKPMVVFIPVSGGLPVIGGVDTR